MRRDQSEHLVDEEPFALSTDDLWRPVQRQRTHEQVLARVEELIVSGDLRSGDRLPSERQLAESMQVSRTAVREAMRVLEAMGIVTAATGSGPTAGSIITGQQSPALSTVLRLQLALSSFSQRELMEVRVQLERWGVQEAARHDDQDRLGALDAVVLAMRDDTITHDRFNELDTEFHVGLAEASGNTLLTLMMRALRDAVHREMTTTFQRLENPISTRQNLCEEHAGILEAVVSGDGPVAATRVERHIEAFYESLERSHG